jgi:arsenite methyltransferase
VGALRFDDDDAARRIEALYRTRDAGRRRGLVLAALGASPGDRVLDVGCGPGFYCAELLDQVGPEGSVVGVDPSPAMLALAAGRCEGRGDIRLLDGDARALPVPDGAFDGAICVQVLEYVEAATEALAEIRRALRPGGRIVVWDVDWGTLSVHAADAERNARVLRAWDEHLVHPALPRTLAARMRAAGFGDVRMGAHPFVAVDWDPESYGVASLPLIARFVAGRQGLTEDDAQAWLEEQRVLGERGELYFACLQLAFTAIRPPTGR